MSKDIKGNEIGPGDTCALVHRMSKEWKGKKAATPPQVVLVRLVGETVEDNCYTMVYKKCLAGSEPGDGGTTQLADRCTAEALLKIPDNIKDDASILGFIKLSGYFTDEG